MPVLSFLAVSGALVLIPVRLSPVFSGIRALAVLRLRIGIEYRLPFLGGFGQFRMFRRLVLGQVALFVLPAGAAGAGIVPPRGFQALIVI